MPRLLAVDPGLQHTGFALFNGEGVLQKAWVSSLQKKLPLEERVAAIDRECRAGERERAPILAIELMQTYDGHAAKGDANTLIALAYLSGVLASDRLKVVTYTPAAWKGQVPKEIVHERIREIFKRDGGAELLRIPALAKGKLHNALDAIGIGLVFLGRLHTYKGL